MKETTDNVDLISRNDKEGSSDETVNFSRNKFNPIRLRFLAPGIPRGWERFDHS